MAEDLREVIAALKVASSLERIGDYAKNMARRALTLQDVPPIPSCLLTLERLGELVQGMIKDVLDAYLSHDLDKAMAVRDRDEDVDKLHTSLFRELLTYMMEDPRNITFGAHLLFVAKNLERVGDHVTSIAEQIHFALRGERLVDTRVKQDVSYATVVKPSRRAISAAKKPLKKKKK